MKARFFFQNLKEETFKALKSNNASPETQNDMYKEIQVFFKENMDIDYNAFISAYNEKYGNIIKQYRETQKVKAIITI